MIIQKTGISPVILYRYIAIVFQAIVNS